jgi:hypothetical protein
LIDDTSPVESINITALAELQWLSDFCSPASTTFGHVFFHQPRTHKTGDKVHVVFKIIMRDQRVQELM